MGRMERYAILLDGEFVRRKLSDRLKRRIISAADLSRFCESLSRTFSLESRNLYRIYYHTAEVVNRKVKNPLTEAVTEIGKSEHILAINKLHLDLEQTPHFAVRRGATTFQGWRIKRHVAKKILNKNKSREIQAQDIEPDLKQKGVDMQIGLDISALALKRHVETIVVVTGDADIIPALKFARREGLRVMLAMFDKSV